MEPIVSRSEFPDEDDEQRPSVDRQHKADERRKITRSPDSITRARKATSDSAGAEADTMPDAYGSMSTFDYTGATIDGRYLVERRLGEGGMGVVYLCRHIIIDKKVAIKVLRADLARNDEVTERFLNEARSASSIGNPHIIDISDFGRLPDGTTYFVMEYLTGISLANIVEDGSLMEEARFGHVALQLCEGLAAAHAAGIVHRDLKPDNIFLVEQGSRRDFVKILDFGIAKVSRFPARLTQAGQVFGTPHYMSPEQANGDEVDARSDIYALGVILYELSTGQLPFDADNYMAILTQHMHKEPPPPSLIPGVLLVPGLEPLILKCLAKSPVNRFQTMVEVMSELRLIFSDLLPPISRDTPQVPIKASSQPARLPSQPHLLIDEEAKNLKPPFGRYLAIAASLFLVGSLLAWGLARRAKPQDQQLEPDASPAAAEQSETPERGMQSAQTQGQQNTQPEGTPSPAVKNDQVKKNQVAIAVFPSEAHLFDAEKDLGSGPWVIEVGEEARLLHVRLDGYPEQELKVDGSQPAYSLTLKKRKPTSEPRQPTRVAPPPQPSIRRSGSETSGVVNPWE